MGEAMRTLALLLLAGCAPPFVPAYVGEPDCGRPDALHAIERATCDGSIMVACSCDDRNTLECVNGAWVYSHQLCEPGLAVHTEQP